MSTAQQQQLASVVQQHNMEPKRRISVLERRMSAAGVQSSLALEVQPSGLLSVPTSSAYGRGGKRRTSLGSSIGAVSAGGTSEGALPISAAHTIRALKHRDLFDGRLSCVTFDHTYARLSVWQVRDTFGR
jgi:hypothetical protein